MNELPINLYKNKIIESLKDCQHAVVISSTGSGKTTIIPKLLLEDFVANDSCIGVTQPRRLAAIKVAEYVSENMNETIGLGSVGYSVRFDDKCSKNTRLKFMTDGILLRESLTDPLLTNYGIIVVDEAHERRIESDLCLGIIKNAVLSREKSNKKPLKVIVMSATINPSMFVNFFGGPNKVKTIFVEGRQHPIKIYTGVKLSVNCVCDSICAALQIHKEDRNLKNGILVFLPGEKEINNFVSGMKTFLERVRNAGGNMFDAFVFPLHSSLPIKEQTKAVSSISGDSRKIVAATNIAETSITISDISYVIDSGLHKVPHYNHQTGVESLVVEKISQYQAWQRSGRAGREKPGVCIRLFTQEDFESRRENNEPEIKFKPLHDVLLTLFELGFNKPEKFHWITPPKTDQINEALRYLSHIGAIENVSDCMKITKRGSKLSAIPLSVKLSEVILSSHQNNCVAEILSIVSLLYLMPIFFGDNINKIRSEASFYQPGGDIFTYLHIFKNYKKLKKISLIERRRWCTSYFLNKNRLDEAIKARKQLKDIIHTLYDEVDFQTRKDYKSSIIRAFIGSSFRNQIAKLKPTDEWRNCHIPTYSCESMPDVELTIHPSSFMFKEKPSKFILFLESIESANESGAQMRHCTAVESHFLAD